MGGDAGDEPFFIGTWGEILQLSQLWSNQSTSSQDTGTSLNGAPELCGSTNSYREETRIVCDGAPLTDGSNRHRGSFHRADKNHI